MDDDQWSLLFSIMFPGFLVSFRIFVSPFTSVLLVHIENLGGCYEPVQPRILLFGWRVSVIGLIVQSILIKVLLIPRINFRVQSVQSPERTTVSTPRLRYGQDSWCQFSWFLKHSESKDCGKKESSTRGHGWTAAVKRVMIGASMRRIQERVLGLNKTGISISSSDIWLLGVCYKISQEYFSADPAYSNGFAAFVEDFESRILMTYRKGLS